MTDYITEEYSAEELMTVDACTFYGDRCMNGGQCYLVDANDFSCSCSGGAYGDLCEMMTDDTFGIN